MGRRRNVMNALSLSADVLVKLPVEHLERRLERERVPRLDECTISDDQPGPAKGTNVAIVHSLAACPRPRGLFLSR